LIREFYYSSGMLYETTDSIYLVRFKLKDAKGVIRRGKSKMPKG